MIRNLKAKETYMANKHMNPIVNVEMQIKTQCDTS